jgi:CheY-like chemotaxis protein
MWVESTDGEGAVFHFTARFGKVAAPPSPAPEPGQYTGVQAVTGPLRVLLAEDNPVNQKLTVRLLEKHGHIVVVAGNGREALAAIARHRFDLVLMDVQMPEMDGLEAARAIRVQERTTGEHLPIIAMTAHAMNGDREICLEAGMDRYIRKPISAAEFFAAIGQAAGGAGSRIEPKPIGN